MDNVKHILTIVSSAGLWSSPNNRLAIPCQNFNRKNLDFYYKILRRKVIQRGAVKHENHIYYGLKFALGIIFICIYRSRQQCSVPFNSRGPLI